MRGFTLEPFGIRLPLFQPRSLGIDDQDRAEKALKGITGKRLTYRGPSSFEAPF
jgi:hypothetical protein